MYDELSQLINETIDEDQIKHYSRFFDLEIDQNDTLISFGQNNEKFKNENKYIGYFVIISNLKRSPEEILETYKKRVAIEKTFRALKT